MKFIFTYERYQRGWLLNDAPEHFYPCDDGRMVAHDCIEHGAHDDGSVEDELKALGGVLFGRIMGCYIPDGGWKPISIASDINQMVEDAAWQGLSIPPRTREIDDEDELQAQLDKALTLGVPDAISESGGMDMAEYSMLVERCRGWLRIGYNVAKRRYGTPYNMVTMFDTVKTAVDEISDPDDGDQLIVKVNYKQRKVSVTHRERYW